MKVTLPTSNKIVSVKPMIMPKSTIFYMDFQYNNTINIKQWEFLMFLNKKYERKFPRLDEIIKSCKYYSKEKSWLNRLIKLYQREYFAKNDKVRYIQ